MSKKKEEYRDLKLTAHEYTCLSEGYYETGLFDSALECAENVLYLYRRDPSSVSDEELSYCVRMRARILSKNCEKKEWKRAFKAAERLTKKQKDEVSYADCLVDKGTAYACIGRDKKAVRLRKKALKVLEGKQDGDEVKKEALYLLGSAYYAKKDDKKADKYFSEAYDQGDATDELLFMLGSVKVRKGEYERAVDYLIQCRAMREEKYREMPFHAALGEIYLLLGDVYSMMKVYVKAVKLYAKALRTYEIEGGDEVGYVETCKRLYGTYKILGEEDRAESFLMRVEE